MVICIAEDRISEEDAIRCLLLSLVKQCPGVQVILYFPPATGEFKAWIAKLAQIQLRCTPFPEVLGWSVKPYALLALLQEGYEEVWWVDSDVIVSRDFRSTVCNLNNSTFVATEDALFGFYRDEGYRAKAWGFEIGRLLPFCLNTGIIRVTQQHIPLLQRWQQLMKEDAYLKTQTLPYNCKPFHLFGDQDVLTALLTSREFSDIPLKVLRRGEDIIQYFGPAGYTVGERFLSLLKGIPPFIHSQGEKPWYRQKKYPRWTNFFEYLSYARLEVSPYNQIARQYKDQLEKEMDWLTVSSPLGKFLSLVGFGNVALTGMPIAIIYSLWRLSKQFRGINDSFDPKQAYQSYMREQGSCLAKQDS